MTTNTVFISDFIIAKQNDTLVMHQGIYGYCPNEIKRKRRLYGYDYT